MFVTEERVNVKNIYIEDATSKCKLALWHCFAEKDIGPGEYVHITDVAINTFRNNEVSLPTTSKAKITEFFILDTLLLAKSTKLKIQREKDLNTSTYTSVTKMS